MNNNMNMGDLLYRSKGFVKHNGVYIGGSKVLHNSPTNGTEIVSHEEFSNGYAVSVVSTQIADKDELAKRIYNVLNENSAYHFAFNNCEHIANYLVYVRKFSPQIQATIGGAFVGYLLSDKNDTTNQLVMSVLGGVIACTLSNALRT